jgi:hypothetical protein
MENVVSIFTRNRTQTNTVLQPVASAPQAVSADSNAEQSGEKFDFKTAVEKNATVQSRLKKEREQANKGVLKNYRIK